MSELTIVWCVIADGTWWARIVLGRYDPDDFLSIKLHPSVWFSEQVSHQELAARGPAGGPP